MDPDVIPKVAYASGIAHLVFIMGLGGILIVSVRLVFANRAKEQVNAQLAKNVRDFEWQKDDELIATGKRADALAYLSAFLRRDPNDRAAANRLVSMLSGCKLCAAHDYTAAARDRSKLARVQQRRRRVLTASDDGKARIWDLGSGRAICTLCIPLKSQFRSFCVR